MTTDNLYMDMMELISHSERFLKLIRGLVKPEVNERLVGIRMRNQESDHQLRVYVTVMIGSELSPHFSTDSFQMQVMTRDFNVSVLVTRTLKLIEEMTKEADK